MNIYFALQVIEKTCVEVTAINPSKLCMNRSSTDITLMGRGFKIKLNRALAACRFRTSSEDIGNDPVVVIIM